MPDTGPDPLDPPTPAGRHAAGRSGRPDGPASPARSASRARVGRTGGVLAVLAALAVGTATIIGGHGSATPGGEATDPGQVVDLSSAQPVALSTFTSCDTLLSYYRSHALPQVGPYGLPNSGIGYAGPLGMLRREATGVSASAATAAPAAAAGNAAAGSAPQAATDMAANGGVGATSAGGTNVQVAGVDEADVSKRVGDLVLTVATDGQRPGLVVLRTGAGTAKVIGRLDTADWSPTSLLVDGTQVLLVGPAAQAPVPQSGTGPRTGMAIYQPLTRVMQVDLSDPAHPVAGATLDLGGTQVGVRMVDGEVRLAVNSSLHPLPFVPPQYPVTPGGPVAKPAPASAPAELQAPGSAVPDAAGSGPDNPVPGSVAPPPDSPPSQDQIKAAEDAATAANRALVSGSSIEDWLPTYALRQPDGTSSTGRLVDCADVSAPNRFSGLDTLSLVSIDLRADGVRKWTSAAVVAAGTTLYATPDHTYLAATTWTDPATATSGTGSGSGSGAKALPQVTGGQSTQIHLFDTSGRNRPHYVASGEVTGALLNQFSMDEFGGDLRVATTTSPTGGPILMGGGTVMLGDGSGGGSGGGPAVDVAPIPPGDSAGIAGGPSGGAGASSGQASASSGQASASSGQAAAPVSTSAATAARAVTADGSRVTVLRRSGDRLGAVGQVSGLGRGEQIYAVRFVGAVGYVVTFRQTDPLYTLDLSDAKAPRVVGELKLLGYSAYLHPAGDGLLIGIGQSADGAGHVQGLQLSLFDVHDPARPVRLSQVKLPQAWSDAQGDHHAFTFADGLVLIPFQRNDFGIVAPVAASADGSVVSTPAMPLQDSGVVAVRLAGQRLGTPTYLRMQGSGPVRSDLGVPFVQPLRTYVDGGDIWTVTTAGLGVHDATTLKRLGFTRF